MGSAEQACHSRRAEQACPSRRAGFRNPVIIGSSPATLSGWVSAARPRVPKLSFADLQKCGTKQKLLPLLLPLRRLRHGIVWAPEEPAPAAEWSAPAEPKAGGDFEPVSSGAPFASEEEESPFASSASESSAPEWSAAPSSAAPSVAPSAAPAGGESPASLTEDQVERIARRVVELLSEKTIQNIAWEVLPDMARTIVRDEFASSRREVTLASS